jgi:hypothetical protein
LIETHLRPQISLLTIFIPYFITRLTAFSMVILKNLMALMMDHHLLSEEEMKEELAIMQLYPGSLMVDLC